MSVILGIDLGTSSVKAMLLDSFHGVLGVESGKYDVGIPREGYAEQEPLTWWEETKKVILKLKDSHKEAFEDIKAVGFSGQMHGIVLTDEGGRPLRPAILWLDQRSKRELLAIQKKIDFEKMGNIFKTRVYTGFGFPSLMWVKEHEPEILSKTKAVMMPKDFIRYKMTGKIASDVTDASSTAIFDTAKRTWAYEVIREFGLPEEIFPPCGESMDIAGYVTKKCEKECGLKEGIPVVYGAGDQQAQSIGNGIYEEGKIICNIGTGGQISAYVKDPVYDKKLRTHTFCHPIDKGYTIYGATLCSGMSLNWLKNKILKIEDFDSLSRMAGEVPAGSEGLVYLPYLTGERTPHMDPCAKGMFAGLVLGHDRRHMVRAVMEGVTLSLRDSLSIFQELGIKCDTIIASGGGAKSREWLQMQADIFKKKVIVCEVSEQACLGACILAGVGTGLFDGMKQAIEKFVVFRDEIYEPDPSNERVYDRQYERFQNLYRNNKEWMVN